MDKLSKQQKSCNRQDVNMMRFTRKIPNRHLKHGQTKFDSHPLPRTAFLPFPHLSSWQLHLSRCSGQKPQELPLISLGFFSRLTSNVPVNSISFTFQILLATPAVPTWVQVISTSCLDYCNRVPPASRVLFLHWIYL